MRLGLTLACVFALCVLGIVAVVRGPLSHGVFGTDTLLVAALVFFSCSTGMFVTRITERSRQAELLAAGLARANLALEAQVCERTVALREKVMVVLRARRSTWPDCSIVTAMATAR